MKKLFTCALLLLTSACLADDREARIFTFDNHIGDFPNPSGEPYLNMYPFDAASSTGLAISPVEGDSANRCLMIVDSNTANNSYSKFTLAYIDGLEDGDMVTVEAKVLAKDLFRMGYNFEAGRNFGDPQGPNPSSYNGFITNDGGNYQWDYAGGISYCSQYDYGDTNDNDGEETTWQTLNETFVFSAGNPVRDGGVIVLYCAHNNSLPAPQYAYADDLTISLPFRDTDNDGINDVKLYFPDLTSGEEAPVPTICGNRPLSDIASDSGSNSLDCTCNIFDFSALATAWGTASEKDVENIKKCPEYTSYKTVRTGWENSEITADPNLALVVSGYDNDSIGYYNYHRPTWEVASEGANDTNGHSLKCIMGPYPDNVELYVCKIYGLSAGDKIAASLMARKGEGNVRMWAHYIDSVEALAGSAGGDTGYPTSTTQWSRLSHEWTFEDPDNDRYGLVIKIRCYGNSAGTISGLVDDLMVRVPEYCDVYFPGPEWNANNGTPDYMLPICPERLNGDIDLSNTIDIGDMAILASEWLISGIEN